MQFRIILKNTAWMGLVQALNVALPILTVPLVSRAFGPSVYGLVASLAAIAGYANLIIMFGFHLSGPRTIVRATNDPVQVSQAFSSIYLAQLLLAATTGVVILVALPLLRFSTDEIVLGGVILVGVIASALTPLWMFQGLQRMRQVAVSQLVTKIAGAVLLFAFIRTQADVFRFVIINTAVAVACLGWSFFELRRLGYALRMTSRRDILETLRSSSRIFMSTVAINVYTASTIVVVSLVAGPVAAGYFALADRIRGATVGVLDPVSQALYPYLCGHVSSESEQVHRARNRRIFFRLMVVLSASSGLCLFFLSPLMAGILGGEKFAATVPILKVLSVTPFLICLNNLLGFQVMMPLDMEAELSVIIICAASVGLPFMIVMTWIGGALGTAYAYVIVEFGITLAELALVSRREPIWEVFLPWGSRRVRQPVG